MLTEWIIRGIYSIFIRSDYIIFSLPYVHLTKYFVVFFICIILFKRYGEITSEGKKILPIFSSISIIGILVTSLWFNAITDQILVKYRTIWWEVHEWDEVDYIQTEILVKKSNNRPTNSRSYKRSKVDEKYVIHFDDGSVINAWENVSSVYNLHHFVMNKNIDVKYTNEVETFNQNYKHHFKNELQKAKFIFLGIDKKW